MTGSLDINEALMIKNRLREAYNNIQLISENDFVQDSQYKQSHQVLCARIKDLEDAESAQCETERYVEDVIPNSHLAKYGHYAYNDFRERSYTPNPCDTPFLHPYLAKNDVVEEPWMYPDVERIFIHTLCSTSKNFSLYETELEKLEKRDERGEESYREFFSFCGTPEYQNSSASSADQSLDNSPERSTSSRQDNNDNVDQESNLEKDLPYYFEVSEPGGFELRNKILSDKVKHLWEKKKTCSKDYLLDVYKTMLDNIIFKESAQEYRYTVASGDTDLQKLVTFIVDLHEKLPNLTEVGEPEESSSQCHDISLLPQRRLYSDVVQGNTTAPKSGRSLYEPSSPKSNGFLDETPSGGNSKTLFLNLDIETNSSLEFIDRLQEPLDAPSPSTEGPFENEASESEENPCEHQPAQAEAKLSPTKVTYTEPVNNGYGSYPINQYNMPFVNDATGYDNQPKALSVGGYQPNPPCQLQYLTEPSPYAGSLNFNRYAPAPNQMALARPQVNQNWYVSPTYRRTPTPYSFFLLPQMPTKHRWINPQYVRPNTIYNAGPSQSQPATWPCQPAPINRSASNQQVANACYPIYDPAKIKKKTIAPVVGKFPRSKTPEMGKPKKFAKQPPSASSATSTAGAPPKYPSKILTKPNSDYRIMARQDGDCAAPPNAEKAAAGDRDPLIAVDCSESEELEEIALREYQSSHDMFFTEIERQAKEQYDGNPENSYRPPNSRKGLLRVGGLRALNFILHFYFTFNSR